MAKTLYKQITIFIKDGEDNISIKCLGVSGEAKLAVGDLINVSGALTRSNGALQFGRGCTCVKATVQSETDAELVDAVKNLAEGQTLNDGTTTITGTVSIIEKATTDLPQKITNYIGAFVMLLTGVAYMIMSDVYFNNTSDRLIVAVLLSFGSAALFFASATFNEKPVLRYIFKGCGLALAIGFVVYIHLFSVSEWYLAVLEKLRGFGLKKATEYMMSKVTIIMALVLGYISIVAQASNVVVEAVIKDDTNK